MWREVGGRAGDLLVVGGFGEWWVPAIYWLYLDGGFVRIKVRTKVQMSLSTPWLGYNFHWAVTDRWGWTGAVLLYVYFHF